MKKLTYLFCCWAFWLLPKTIVGQTGEALHFDGSNDHVELGTWFNLPIFTLEMWVKPAATQNTFANIMDNNHTNDRSWVVQQDGTGAPNSYVFGVNGTGAVGFSLTANVWQHLACVKTPVSIEVYLNGNLIGSEVSTDPINYDGTQFLRLGKWGGGGRHWRGTMDEVRIWAFPLAQSQIGNIYNCQVVPDAGGLLSYFQMNQGTAGGNNSGETTLQNAVAGGTNGTLVNFSLNGSTSNWVAPGAAASQHPDFEALMALYNSTDGANWNTNFGWTDGATGQSCDPCNFNGGTWQGINCQLGRVTEILLPANNLVGELPADIGNLSNLTYLDLNSNALSNTLPASLTQLANLTHLDLWGNQFSGELPTDLGNLSQLIHLDLGQNQFNGGIPASLGNLTDLPFLNLSYNTTLNGCYPSSLNALTDNGFLNDYISDGNDFDAPWSEFVASGAGECGACNHPDFDALVAMYNSLGGANWTNKTGWQDGAAGTNCEPCTWFGVECDANNRVKYIFLEANNLVGTLPADIGGLEFLENLGLQQNSISSSLPAEIGNLTKLSWLNLSNNSLSGALPDIWTGVPDLTYLNLASNQFQHPLPASFFQLSNLTELDLWQNNFAEPLPAALSNLTSLTSLNLGFNQFSGEIPSSIGTNLTSLISLQLIGNQLDGSIPSTFSDLENLDYLNLAYNDLGGPLPAGALPDFWASFPNLTVLQLDWNSFTGSLPPSLGSLSKIQHLSIIGTQIGGSIPSSMGSLTTVQNLHLAHNQLVGNIPATFSNLTNLQPLGLSLNGNDLSGCFDPALFAICSATNDAQINDGNDFEALWSAFCTAGGPPLPTAQIDGETSICPNATTPLSTASIGTFEWSNGETDSEIEVGIGTYFLTLTNAIGCTASDSHTISANGVAPVLELVGAGDFTSHVVSPTSGSAYQNFQFQVKFTHADLPAASFPRLILKFNPPAASPNDLILAMSETDPTDDDPTDGKIYSVNYTGLQVGQNWAASFLVEDAMGCTTTWESGLSEPDVLDFLDIEVFANDISFSVPHPDENQQLTVVTHLENPSDFAAANFVVRLRNEFTQTDYGTQTVANFPAHTGMDLTWNITAPSVASWNPIRVFIDDTDVLDETNELNNNAVRPFICGDFSLPGGIAVAVSVADIYQNFDVFPPAPVVLNGTAVYEGLPPALGLNGTPVAGAEVSFFIPEFGQNFTTTTNSAGAFSITVADSYDALGLYHIVDGEVTDFSLTGDFETDFEILDPNGGNPPPPCTLADLVSEAVPSAATSFPNDSRTFEITVENVGAAAAAASQVKITPLGNLSPATIEFVAVPALAVGATHTFSRTYTMTAVGTATLNVLADATFQEAECSEGNNGGSGAVQILQPLPDLVVQGFSLVSTLLCGDNSFSFQILNVGNTASAASSAQVRVVRLADDFEIFNQYFPISALAAGASQSVSVADVFTTTDQFRVEILADANSENDEIDESNELFNFVQMTNCQADLVLDGSGTLSNFLETNGLASTLTFPVKILNLGQQSVTTDFVLRAQIFNGSTVVSTDDLTISTDLAPNEFFVQNLTVSNPTAGQPYTLILTADATNLVSEISDANNSAGEFQLYHEYAPAQACPTMEENSPVDWFDHPVVRDVPTQPFCFVHKRGDFRDNQLKIKFEARKKPDGAWLNLGTSTLAPVVGDGQGGSDCPSKIAVAPYPFSFTEAGLWELRVTTDPNSAVAETDETNNVLLHDFTVVETPDLAIFSYQINPSNLNPNPGETISIDVSYQNQGQSIAAGDDFSIELKVDNDVVGTTTHGTAGMPSGSISTKQFSFTVPSGWAQGGAEVHLLRATVDKNLEINEFDEMNNEATRAFVVGLAPDLLVQSLSFSAGQIQIFVKNEGNGPAASGLLNLFWRNAAGTLTPILGGVDLPIGGLSVGNSQVFNLDWTADPSAISIFAEISAVAPTEFDVLNNSFETFLGGNPLVLFGSSIETCSNVAEGTAAVSASGGTAPYSFLWSNGATDASISMLAAGDYSVVVSDGAGATAELAVTVDSKPAPQTSIAGTSEICAGGSTTFTASAIFGGGAPYSFVWGDGSTTAEITVSTAATYSVTATSMNGCTDDAAMDLTVHPLPMVSIDGDRDICAGTSTVWTAQSTPAGVSWGWNNSATSQAITINSTGNYAVQVIDIHGCTGSANANLTVHLVAGILATTDNEICPGETTTITSSPTGGFPPYSFSWKKDNAAFGSDVENLTTGEAGVYTLTITDSEGCPNLVPIASLEIFGDSEEPEITCPANISVPVATGTCSAAVSFSGSATDNCAVDFTDFSPASGSIFSAGQTWVTMTATDLTGNENTCSFKITVVPPLEIIGNGQDDDCDGLVDEPALTITFTLVHPTCFGNSNGTIFTTVSLGTPPYTYLWNTLPPKTTRNINLLSAGSYTLTVTDLTGATASATAILVAPQALDFTYVKEGSNNNWSVTFLNPTGGTPPYTFCRKKGGLPELCQSSNFFTGLTNGAYIFKMKDAFNCQKTILKNLTPSSLGNFPNEFVEMELPAALEGVDDELILAWFEGQISQERLVVFPNPTRGELRILLPQNVEIDSPIRVFDALGRLVRSDLVRSSANDLQSLSLEGLPAGVFQIVILDASGKPVSTAVVLERAD